MIEDSFYRNLMDYSMRALSRRAHTIHEMRLKLRKRPHHKPEQEEAVINRLMELNLLNDEAYLERAIENTAQYKLQGMYKLAHNLAHKGIAFEKIEKKWKKMNLNEEQIAKKALKKIEKKLKEVPKEQRYQKKAQFLASRGFSPEIIFELAKSYEPM